MIYLIMMDHAIPFYNVSSVNEYIQIQILIGASSDTRTTSPASTKSFTTLLFSTTPYRPTEQPSSQASSFDTTIAPQTKETASTETLALGQYIILMYKFIYCYMPQSQFPLSIQMSLNTKHI